MKMPTSNSSHWTKWVSLVLICYFISLTITDSVAFVTKAFVVANMDQKSIDTADLYCLLSTDPYRSQCREWFEKKAQLPERDVWGNKIHNESTKKQ